MVYNPDGTIGRLGGTRYYYNYAGQMTCVMPDCGLGANYEYDNNGALIKTECDNGLTTTYTRDSLRAGFAGETALLDARYTYDGNGNHTGKNEKFFLQNDRTPTGAVTQYAYDGMNRLTMENRNGLATAYTYDLAGNKTGRLKGDDREEYRYNSRNQLTELTGMGRRTSYQYDPAGNLTQEQRIVQEHAETRKYTYDAYNRNTEVRGEDFLHKNFYDAEGLRNRIEENGKATDFVYSGDMLYSEKEVNSTRERRYILGNEYLGHEDTVQDVTFSGENQKQEYSYITDEQGSLRYILNADRQTETYQEYSAFGERIFQEGASSRLGYNSQMGDELTGLTYLRARYYNPEIGRFTQEDVIYDDGFNLYAYCGSNPVIYSDPSGFVGEDVCGPFYEKLKEAFKNNPSWNADPDKFVVVQGKELAKKRAEYNSMVRKGELPAGHHIQGLADGGSNTIDNIKVTGEKFINRDDLPASAVEYYDKYYASETNPHPQRIAVYEENGRVSFGKNPNHTDVTTMQNELHGWQREEGLRTESSKGISCKKKKG